MLKISLPNRMVSEIFLVCQQSATGIVRHGALPAVTVAWRFKLCLDDQLRCTPVFSNHLPPAAQIRDWVKSSLQLPCHTWMANNIISAPTWRRVVA